MYDHIHPEFFEFYKGIVATVDAIAKNEKVVAYYASKSKTSKRFFWQALHHIQGD
jgi:hypothetical protein